MHHERRIMLKQEIGRMVLFFTDQPSLLAPNIQCSMRGYALSYLSSCAGRIRFLLGTPGMVALDLDAILKGLFQRIVQHLENIPKPQVTKCNLERP
ncbi:hypothetical protein OROMI_012537 [Orobanche minor]